MKILGIVPARGGSQRILQKNKKLLAGKELVRYAIEAALDSALLTDIIVSSDDLEILQIARSYANIIALERPVEISDDKALAITYVQHALDSTTNNYDVVAIIQPSSPFTLGSDIDGTMAMLEEKSADSAASVMKLDHAIHPFKLKVIENGVLHAYLEEEGGRMAAHELPDIYIRNGSVYAMTIEVVHSGRIIGDRCAGYIMPRERSLDINDELDFRFAEFLIDQNA